MTNTSCQRFAALGVASLLVTACVSVGGSPAFADGPIGDDSLNASESLPLEEVFPTEEDQFGVADAPAAVSANHPLSAPTGNAAEAPEQRAVRAAFSVESGYYYDPYMGETLEIVGMGDPGELVTLIDMDGNMLGETIVEPDGNWYVYVLVTGPHLGGALHVVHGSTPDIIDIYVDILGLVITVNPPAPTLSTPEDGQEATVILPDVEGVDYTVERVGDTFVVTATPQPGYELEGDTEWILEIPEIVQPPIQVTPIAPKLSDPAPGERATVILPDMPGIKYIVVPHPDDPENMVSVFVDSVEKGYVLAPGSDTYWEFKIPAIVNPGPGSDPNAGNGTDSSQAGSSQNSATSPAKPGGRANGASSVDTLALTGDQKAAMLTTSGRAALVLGAGIVLLRGRTRRA
ncbi:hypothetical protein G7067_01375 [Leucobacter insecticola]|uniref:Gram-positive cocci surface proteins LPxTG domain-containing protein n=1 Tax=Leucobacter insecticola TaxID=2714934 RepID=A0A6G8FGA0_9MICO|nr:hypothetical protein [Leucobacter insecticola]QIM15365.1 hypothetical protein G7067_01375 [Leucobacter insecticola]